jgi:hypothetical protein
VLHIRTRLAFLGQTHLRHSLYVLIMPSLVTSRRIDPHIKLDYPDSADTKMATSDCSR